MHEIVLFTGYALLAVVCAYAAFAAISAARAAERSEARLLTQKGRIVALEHATEALDLKLRKLAGRVYATERRDPPEPEPEVPEPPDAIRARLRAQLQHPHSRSTNGSGDA